MMIDDIELGLRYEVSNVNLPLLLVGVGRLILLARPNGMAISMIHYINAQIWSSFLH